MDTNKLNINTGTGTGTGGGTGSGAGEDLVRISVSRVADEALGRMVDRVNEDFEGGKLTRAQLASWSILQASDSLTDVQIREIRAEHLDEFAFLESIMRKAKRSGRLPPELRSFMNKQLGLEDNTKKRKKQLSEDARNDDMLNDDNV